MPERLDLANRALISSLVPLLADGSPNGSFVGRDGGRGDADAPLAERRLGSPIALPKVVW